MNLAKHDPETDMEMNLTPMIDVVFLLIIFFMIITDLTQQDLEELQLPVAQHASPDKPNKDEWRPVLNVPWDGRMVVKRDALYDPEIHDSNADPYKGVKLWLADASDRMVKEHFNKEAGTGPMIPGEALLIRADATTSFKHVQKIMEFCGQKGVEIWKVQLAAAEDSADDKNK
ncbi:MAG: biopolymer transport protein ExbD [Planctomycetota bacterium]|jgi:biopolymer transport protein ExbD